MFHSFTRKCTKYKMKPVLYTYIMGLWEKIYYTLKIVQCNENVLMNKLY